jgi:CDP-glucose 4,6-dehydratase
MTQQFWARRPVFITGANGFVGSWVARALVDAGAQVIALVRDQTARGGLELQGIAGKVTQVSGDLGDAALLHRVINEYAVDTCFHLAAQAIVGVSNRSPVSTFETNIRGTWNLLEACRNVSTVTRCVVASSDKAYGRQEQLPYRETDTLNGIYPYDASKVCTDILARSYFVSFGLPVAVTRCANVYGGGDLNFSRLVPDSLRSVLQDQRPVLRSDGTPTRDYIYAADAAFAYLTLAEQLDRKEIQGEAFNFGSGQPISALELVQRIIKLSGREHLEPLIKGSSALRGEIDAQYLASDKSREHLGWQPRYTLDQGLSETIDWYSRFLAQEKVKPS